METALENSVWVISPEFAGYLTKRGFHWRKLWKKRWVALHGSEIAYMAEEPNDANSDDLVITKAQISSATFIDREDIDGHPHGFAIHINDGQSPTWYLRAESTREKKSWLMRLGHVHTIVRWLEEFEKVRVLGVGGTGIVYELLHNANGQRYAMKEMEIKNKAQMQMAVAEAEMLKEIMENISHPNIMHIEKVFQVGNKFYLVFPLCTGGELYEHVIRKGHFTEYDAAALMKDLVSALHELHQHDILHLDIKPENILFDSDGPDARIKITDFGLSKVFQRGETGVGSVEHNSRNPTLEELNSKLRAFQESGVLQRDRLRGTVGYMSPELILAGVSTRATDVWAAGVVLYILLCGRPPFQSKSNRDILEKSAKGEFSMEGKEWEGVSAEAKDLVSRMLTVDPERRITTGEILAHPWICMVSNDGTASRKSGTPSTSAGDGASGLAAKRTSATATNLQSALRALSGHVNDRKLEKMASNFTRLVSLLQQDRADGQKLVRLLGDNADGSGAGGDDTDASLSPILNTEIRDALVHVFKQLGGEENGGKLTLEQFSQVLSHFGYGGKDGVHGGGGLLLICRFIDSDGDGLISAEDLFLAEARILQRSPQFLRAIFRVYTESVWYPGRQLNHMSMQRGPSAGKQVARTGILQEGNMGATDVVEPPKYITGRNVAAVFERLGYNPEAGVKLFGALCEALARRREQLNRSVSNAAESYSAETASPPPVLPPSPVATPTKPARNAALSALVGGIAETVSALALGPSTATSSSTTVPPSQPAAMASPSTASATAAAGGTGGGSELSAPGGAKTKEYRMDAQDFCDAVEIDDVLIQVIQVRPRARMKRLMLSSAQQADGGSMATLLSSLNSQVTGTSGDARSTGSASSNTLSSGEEASDGHRSLSRNDTEKLSEALTQEFRKALTPSSST